VALLTLLRFDTQHPVGELGVLDGHEVTEAQRAVAAEEKLLEDAAVGRGRGAQLIVVF
jgi:hypothetical protein